MNKITEKILMYSALTISALGIAYAICSLIEN